MIPVLPFFRLKASGSVTACAVWSRYCAAVEDIKRGYDLGVRGFLIYDEGMLWLVGQMRKDGALPKDIIFKTSAHLGQCNPCSFKLLESLGADSINPVRDLQIPMIAALRAGSSGSPGCTHRQSPRFGWLYPGL